MLRLVKPAGPRPPRRKGERELLLSDEEERHFRQAIRNVTGLFGTQSALIEAMGTRRVTLQHMLVGRNRVSGDIIVRTMRATGLSLAELLGGPVPTEMCRLCGHVKRGRVS